MFLLPPPSRFLGASPFLHRSLRLTTTRLLSSSSSSSSSSSLNRWSMVPPAIITELSIGAIYSFAMWHIPLTTLQGVVASSPTDFTMAELVPIFSVAAVGLGGGSAPLGNWIDKVGPVKAGSAGVSVRSSFFVLRSSFFVLRCTGLLLLSLVFSCTLSFLLCLLFSILSSALMLESMLVCSSALLLFCSSAPLLLCSSCLLFPLTLLHSYTLTLLHSYTLSSSLTFAAFSSLTLNPRLRSGSLGS